jgi:ankyrin repeat protein
MSTNFNCCNSVTRYVPNTGADDVIIRITKTTTPEEFEQIRKKFPKFQLSHPTKYLGDTVLHKAAKQGNLPLVQYLVQQAPELLERGSAMCEGTPLHASYDAGQIDAMGTLLELGANSNTMINFGDNHIGLLQCIAINQLAQLRTQNEFEIDLSDSINKKSQAMKLLVKYGAERQPEDDQVNNMDLPAIKSLIQKASQEVAKERIQEQEVVRKTIYDSHLLPPSDLCKLVSEFV